MIRINSSVGKGGKNFPADVKCVHALLNVYRRTTGAPPLAITDLSSPALEAGIKSFQIDYMKLSASASARVEPSSPTLQQLKVVLAGVFKPQAVAAPTFGLVTWESEGAEGGTYHSRKLHVPSPSSGLTLGRGYDFRRKSRAKIKSDLLSCSLDAGRAATLSGANGLYGADAEGFIINQDLLDFQLSPAQQTALFKISYEEESSEVQRICQKADVVQLYGKTDWGALHPAIKDITIDLKFRGDYTGLARKLIQKSISANDLAEFKKVLNNQSHWTSVPPDRFSRRVKFLASAK